MAYLLVLIFGALLTIEFTTGFFSPYPEIQLGPPEGDAGEPLFLTPYIEKGDIKHARELSKVNLTEKFNVTSYSGFFTVNKEYNSNHFLWYFPAIEPNYEENPVVVWLSGGPGTSSVLSIFLENGPLAVKGGEIIYKEYNWARRNHMIYIDNPVGAGFSFTNDSRGYCMNQTQIGEQLYSTLTQFFQMFPELQKNRLFVGGVSYAGKYVPALAFTIHKKNPAARVKMNLTALIIGNGFSDPEHQVVMYSQYLFNIGLLDAYQAKEVKKYENKLINFIKNKQWDEATHTFFELLLGDNGLLYNLTGFKENYNYLHTDLYFNVVEMINVINSSNFRKEIHSGNLTFGDGKDVKKYLKQDIMQSVAPWIAELLDHYHLSLFTGQLDIIVAYPLTENYLMNLKFNGWEEYFNGPRKIWKVDGEVAGYAKYCPGDTMQYKIIHTLVRNAGHVANYDQPKWTQHMLWNINSITNPSFTKTPTYN